jgi:hypothetical protein
MMRKAGVYKGIRLSYEDEVSTALLDQQAIQEDSNNRLKHIRVWNNMVLE